MKTLTDAAPLPGRAPPALDVWRIALVVNLAAIVAVGLYFRLARLGSVPGLNADEYFCLVSFQALVSGDPTLGLFVPTGRILDLFYAVPAYLFDLVLPHTAATIRAPAAFSGLLMAAVAFALLRKTRSTFVATVVTVLAVVMPIHISYSRLGWEYSQIPLAALLVVACALKGRVWIAGVALAGGILVHPAIAYLAPMLGFVIAQQLLGKKKPARLAAIGLGVGALFTGLLFLAMRSLAGDVRGMLGEIPGNLLAGQKLGAFLQLYANLFGAGVARQNLSDAPVIVFDAFHSAFLAANAMLYLAYFATFGARRKRDADAGRELAVVCGLLAAIAGFYLTRGPAGVTPPYERYALFLVMPTLIVLAVMVERLATTAPRQGLALAAACAIAWGLLWEFKTGYFDYFEKTGGENAHLTYRTNEVDPKDAAYRWVHARGPAPVIYVKEWRTYWPVHYVASADPSTRVVSLSKTLWTGGLSPEQFSAFLATPDNGLLASLRGTRGYVIGFLDPTFDANLRAQLPDVQVARKDFHDAGGQHVISVWYVDG